MLILRRPQTVVVARVRSPAHLLRKTETHLRTAAWEGRKGTEEIRLRRCAGHVGATLLQVEARRLREEKPLQLLPACTLEVPGRRMSIPAPPLRWGIFPPPVWRVSKAAACPTAADGFRNPERPAEDQASMAQRQPEKPDPAASEKAHWPAAPT